MFSSVFVLLDDEVVVPRSTSLEVDVLELISVEEVLLEGFEEETPLFEVLSVLPTLLLVASVEEVLLEGFEEEIPLFEVLSVLPTLLVVVASLLRADRVPVTILPLASRSTFALVDPTLSETRLSTDLLPLFVTLVLKLSL